MGAWDASKENHRKMGAEEVAKSWETPKGKLLYIEILVALSAILLTVLVLLGLFRRRSSNFYVRVSTWGAYTYLSTLVTYALGQMQGAGFNNELFTVWSLCLLICFGSADTISAYCFEDNDRWKEYNATLVVQFFWVGFLIETYAHGTEFRWLIFLLYVLSSLKTAQRVEAFKYGSREYGSKNAKNFVELSDHGMYDPINMTGYKYLVFGEEKNEVEVSPPDYLIGLKTSDKVITVEQVWQCNGRLFDSSGDPDGRIKDLCLSFALFKLLRKRFFGYPRAESQDPKSRDLILRGLLSRDGDPERAFRVIEVELDFLFDFLYTKYPVVFYNGFTDIIMSTFMTVITALIAKSIFSHYQRQNDDLKLLTSKDKSIEAYITVGVIIAFAVVELLQILIYLTSDWSKVSLLCKYVAKPSWQEYRFVEKGLGTLCRIKLLKPWQNKIGQYSLLESSHCNARILLHRLMGGQKSGIAVKLSTEVKRAVIVSLKSSGGDLSNGERTLSQHGRHAELSWACRLRTHTHTILVWHIATTLCELEEHQHQTGRSEQGGTSNHQSIATSLSKYCAYLIASVPELLPDHTYSTQVIFDKVVSEAKDILKNCKSKDMIYRELMKIGDSKDNMINMGVCLGRQLIDGIEDGGERWQMLAELWAELMLYLAPSDNVTAHVAKLTEGGEFITHLWALLSHAGIQVRPSVPDAV